ncbi:MAG: Zn-ribbon domain-containing OB-fold protein [Alcaligenaceae bacterium]
MNPELPIPVANPDSQVYWDSANQERLMIRHCKACNVLHFMPRYLCPACWSTELEWIQASGFGVVHSFTVVRRAPMKEFDHLVPYVVALIELSEGPRMMANILGPDALTTRIGDQVKVCFEQRGPDAKVPQFVRHLAPESAS